MKSSILNWRETRKQEQYFRSRCIPKCFLPSRRRCLSICTSSLPKTSLPKKIIALTITWPTCASLKEDYCLPFKREQIKNQPIHSQLNTAIFVDGGNYVICGEERMIICHWLQDYLI